MGVYIKGMEMPKENAICVVIFPDGKVTSQFGVPHLGTAVPVPKHRDLIDRDALDQDAQWRLLECNKYDNQFQKPYEVMRAIALAPTVIPASEGDE